MNKSTDALQILEKYRNIVWPEVNKYLSEPVFPTEFSIPKKYKSDVKKYYWNILKEYPERKGKYLRPTIILLVAESMGIDLSKSIKTAAAMQISEEWILIHDDFEDKSTIRRGKKALHRLFGDELAINAGDSLHVIMWKVLFDNFQSLGYKKTLEIANEFYTMLSRTVQGQGVEIGWMADDKPELSDEDWYFVADGKTGYYSMAGPARLGGIPIFI